MKILIEGDEYKNSDLNGRPINVKNYQEVIPIIKNMKPSSSDKKINILRVTYKQLSIFNQFKEFDKYLEMVKKSESSISTINFKSNLLKTLDKFPRLRKSLLSLQFSKDYVKRIK